MDRETVVREQFRTDFDVQFLRDLMSRISTVGHDPYNHIGSRCGIGSARAMAIWHDRALGGRI